MGVWLVVGGGAARAGTHMRECVRQCARGLRYCLVPSVLPLPSLTGDSSGGCALRSRAGGSGGRVPAVAAAMPPSLNG